MNEQNNDNLDTILMQRRVPVMASPGLAGRIIAQAVARKQPSWWEELADMFALPRPAVAFATALVLVAGLALGWEAEGFYWLTQEDWGSFLYINEEWI
ncbi:MAG: hypothetical protein H6868_10045 [Rhodospirillales bacterium]|nr:hypothetical protein [Rhodospirillales bacterium]